MVFFYYMSVGEDVEDEARDKRFRGAKQTGKTDRQKETGQ